MKKVVSFDDPKSCRWCPVRNETIEGCNVAKRPFSEAMQIQIRNGESCQPTWCPLKDLPDYKMDWSGGESYEAGWNDVLDAIGGRDD